MSKADFIHAIGYLVRELDENTGDEIFFVMRSTLPLNRMRGKVEQVFWNRLTDHWDLRYTSQKTESNSSLTEHHRS